MIAFKFRIRTNAECAESSESWCRVSPHKIQSAELEAYELYSMVFVGMRWRTHFWANRGAGAGQNKLWRNWFVSRTDLCWFTRERRHIDEGNYICRCRRTRQLSFAFTRTCAQIFENPFWAVTVLSGNVDSMQCHLQHKSHLWNKQKCHTVFRWNPISILLNNEAFQASNNPKAVPSAWANSWASWQERRC